MRLITTIFAGLLASCAIGCQDQRDDAKNAVSAAKAIMDMAQQSKTAAEAAEKASEAAEAEARAQVAEGTDPKTAEEQVQLAKSIAAMKAMTNASGGPVVNWRQLAPFLPDQLGELEASGKLEGRTNKAAGMTVTHVERGYKAGDAAVKLEITDAAYAPMLRAPFAMAAMVEEDSTEGYRKGTRIGGAPAIVEWNEASKRSTANVLVGQRFMVNVRVTKAANDGAAKAIAGQLDLAKLATLKGEAEEGEAAKPAE